MTKNDISHAAMLTLKYIYFSAAEVPMRPDLEQTKGGLIKKKWAPSSSRGSGSDQTQTFLGSTHIKKIAQIRGTEEHFSAG